MTTIQTTLDLRDAALAQVVANSGDWINQASNLARSLPDGWRGTGEDMRLELYKLGLAAPHHHNAWGALISKLLSSGAIQNTGASRHMVTLKSHGRMTPVYLKIAHKRVSPTD